MYIMTGAVIVYDIIMGWTPELQSHHCQWDPECQSLDSGNCVNKVLSDEDDKDRVQELRLKLEIARQRYFFIAVLVTLLFGEICYS
jgi:hypothetical protein